MLERPSNLDQPALLVVIRRGATEQFRLLQETFAQESLTVLWDRREAERRRARRPAGAERRHQDRRRQALGTWTDSGFIIVPRRISAPGT